MNRNLITSEDALLAGAETTRGGPTANALPVPSQDDYWDRIAKLIPVEILGAYLTLSAFISSKYAHERHLLTVWLFVLLLLGTIATPIFGATVLMIRRPSQRCIMTLGFVVWVFATGGWFATTSWYDPWMGAGAIICFGIFAKILHVRPLSTANQ